jgi:mannose-6-phosphate isomerase-like protein (cupin superfamily)
MQAKFSLAHAISACLALTIGGIAGAAADPGTDAFHLSRAELLAKVSKTTEGLATSTLPTGPDATVIDVRREKSGEVEVHKAKDDILVAHSGRATILVGTEVDGSKETTPGEWRGGEIRQPRRFEMKPGDVLWIPAGLPHQVIVSRGSAFNYLAFKFNARPVP